MRDRECPRTFCRADLIPAAYVKGEPQIYYFTPLHFLDKNYGYTAISYPDYYGLKGDYYSFSTYISNALDSVNNKVILQRTLEELETLYVSEPIHHVQLPVYFQPHALTLSRVVILLLLPLPVISCPYPKICSIALNTSAISTVPSTVLRIPLPV